MSDSQFPFQNLTSLEYLVIGKNVTYCPLRALKNCSNITSIISLNTTPPNITGSNSFAGTTYKEATLYVPRGCKKIYEQTEYWKDFMKILDGLSEDMPTIVDSVYQVAMDVYEQYMSYYEDNGMAFYQQTTEEQADNHVKAEGILTDIEELEKKMTMSNLADETKTTYLAELMNMKESVSALETENDK